MKFPRTAILVLIISVFLGAGVVKAQEEKSVSRIIGMGDSLMDVGNDFIATSGMVPPPTRYVPGRFSNGRIMIEYFSAHFCDEMKPSIVASFVNDSCISYAWGGSTTGVSSFTPGGETLEVPGLLGQVGLLAQDSHGALDADVLVVIWTGANDLLFRINSPREAVANIEDAVYTLVGLGSRRIVILNLPDLTKVPLLATSSSSALRRKVGRFNTRLLRAAKRLRRAVDDLDLTVVDTYAPFDVVLAHPEAFAFSPDIGAGPASGCLFAFVSGTEPDCSPLSLDAFNTNQFFWDELHLSTQAHELVSTVARGATFRALERNGW